MDIISVEGIAVPTGTHEGKKIIIGADHRGFKYKEEIKTVLAGRNYKIIDVGTYSPERCDYPPISYEIGRRISEDKNYETVGIGICGSGIGILIPAAKFTGVCSARCLTPADAATSRKHNNTNMLGIGADCVDLETAAAIIEVWLTTPFYPSSEDRAYLNRYLQTAELDAKSKL